MHAAAELTTILIVEDSPDVVDLLRRVLSEQGYDVRAAPDGEEGLAQRARERARPADSRRWPSPSKRLRGRPGAPRQGQSTRRRSCSRRGRKSPTGSPVWSTAPTTISPNRSILTSWWRESRALLRRASTARPRSAPLRWRSRARSPHARSVARRTPARPHAARVRPARILHEERRTSADALRNRATGLAADADRRRRDEHRRRVRRLPSQEARRRGRRARCSTPFAASATCCARSDPRLASTRKGPGEIAGAFCIAAELHAVDDRSWRRLDAVRIVGRRIARHAAGNVVAAEVLDATPNEPSVED